MTVEETTATPIRVALRGLTAEDSFSPLAQTASPAASPPSLWTICPIPSPVVEDAANPETSRMLRERVVGAVIILVCNPEEPEIPGVLMLRRPVAPGVVETVFKDVQTLVSRRASALGRNFSVPQRLRGMSLKELAANYRFGVTKENGSRLRSKGSVSASTHTGICTGPKARPLRISVISAPSPSSMRK